MTSKKDLLKNSRLYVILDRALLPDNRIFAVANDAASGGCDMIQLRDKYSSACAISETASKLKKICSRYGVTFIVNDNIAAALASGADGVHIGQGDMDIRFARQLMGNRKIIGASAANYREAAAAKSMGADYIGAGPVFATPIKRGVKPAGVGLLRKVKKLRIPVFAIGGINHGNIEKLSREGFKSVAVVRAVCDARDARTATHKLRKALG